MFCGAATWLSPVTRTTWNATDTAAQPVQLANAYDSLRWSAGESSSTQTSANATSYWMEPSFVLTESAWLSPTPGCRGLLKGKTHESADVPPSRGTRTSASWGRSRVGL